MTRDYIGGFGGGFVDGLGAGAQFASQFQEADQLDREQRQSSEMAEKWKKLREDQDANAAATQSDLASLAQPTPAAAPSVQPPPALRRRLASLLLPHSRTTGMKPRSKMDLPTRIRWMPRRSRLQP
ncbi:hypothetical protein ACU4HD_21925 [Cupriavidus basilensis]